VRPHDEQLDDWLGEISDEDWSEGAAERAARRADAPGHAWPESSEPGAADEPDLEPGLDRRYDHAETRRQVVERRRLVAGLVVLGILGVAVLIGVLLLRGGDDTPTTTVAETGPTPTAPSETTASPTETGSAQSGSSTTDDGSTPADSSSSGTTPSTTTPSTTTPSTTGTTPSTSGASGFTLPEGTKLKVGEEADPAVVSELQQALASAGYEPGSVDGSYGEQTAAAVTAFQQDNGLVADGVVGPETAAALNSALAGD
jgi:cytoskeletal protein RodZ